MRGELRGGEARPGLHGLPAAAPAGGPAARPAGAVAAARPAGAAAAARPAVVLIHGWNGHPRHWARIRAGLSARGYPCLVPHLPERLGRQSITDHAREIFAFLNARHAAGPGAGRRPLVLVGYSQGGLAARALLRLYPGLSAAGVVLVGTPNQGSPWGRLRLLAPLRAIADMRAGSGFLEWLNRDLTDLDRVPHLAIVGRANDWEGYNDFLVWEASATMGGRVPARVVDCRPATDAWHGNLINRSWFRFPVPGLVASDRCWPRTLVCLLEFLGGLSAPTGRPG